MGKTPAQTLFNDLVTAVDRLKPIVAASDSEDNQTAIGLQVRTLADAFVAVARVSDNSFSAIPAPMLADRTDATALEYATDVINHAKGQKPKAKTSRSAPAGGGIGHTFNDNAKGKKVGTQTIRPNSFQAVHGIDPSQGNSGFSSLGEMFRDIYRAQVQKLGSSELLAAHGEGSNSAGGFMVPVEFAAELLDAPVEAEIVRPRADTRTMRYESLTINGLKNVDNTDGVVFGGFAAVWTEEHGQMTPQTAQTRRLTLRRKKLSVYAECSNELLDDSDFQLQMVPAMRAAVSDARDYVYLRGNGVGQPRGILNDPALVVVAKESAQAADTISYPNLAKMYGRMHPACIGNSVWVVNPTCIPQLLQLVQVIGTGGESKPVLNESNGTMSMLGRPILLTSKLPVLGDQGDILLVDLSQYIIGESPEIRVAISSEVKFQTDETAFKATYRADGQGKWEGSFQPRNGDTLSWCVTLAARA